MNFIVRSIHRFDPNVLFTLLQRGWTIIAGGISLLLLPYWLNPVEQGYYYAFASFIAMQVFFDLGFNSVIVQFVSHEYSHLSYDALGRVQGSTLHRSRLASLLIMLRRWYRLAALLFFICLYPTGYFFFQTKGDLEPSVWVGPWTVQLFFTAINLYLSPFLAVSEGKGEVGAVAKLRLSQAIIGYSIFWIFLVAGAGLWITPIIPAVGALSTSFWLKGRHNKLEWLPDQGENLMQMSWFREIFPFQWRIALSWISGYFIFSFFTPVVFRHQGAVEAGQLGMTLSIFSSLSALGMSWVSAKVPDFSMLIAKGKRTELNRLFLSVTQRSFIFTSFTCALFIVVFTILREFDFAIAQRLSSLSVMICLMIVTLSNIVIFSAAAYMRAHKEEPMLWNSVTMGIAVLCSVWVFSKVSVFAIMLSYAALVLLVALPWTLLLFFRNYYYQAN